MKNIKIPDFVYYSALTLVILVSFLNFSTVFFPFPDTNTLIAILMTPEVSFPGELYLWGQNFIGTFVPYVANLLHVIYRFPPDLAVSVVTYFILTGGFLAASTLFRSRYIKLLLAMTWFFPSWIFLGHLTTVFGIQFSMLVIGIYLLNRHYKAYTIKMQLLWLSAACIAFIIAIWVSDLSLISLLLLFIVMVQEKREFLRKEKLIPMLKEKQMAMKLIVALAFLFFGIIFIGYAKYHAGRVISYAHPLLNDPVSLLENLKIFIISVFHILIFSTGNITASLFAWSLLIGVPLLVLFSVTKIRFWKFIAGQKWIFFFFLNGGILFLCLILSNWVLKNHATGKFFSLIFISLWTSLLLFLEITESSKPSLRNYLLPIMILLGVISSLAPLYIPENVEARSTALEGLKNLNVCGIIGESGEVFAAASADPNHIKPLPHEGEVNRNSELEKEVFRQHTIYFVGNNWLSSYPDTLRQYGVLFQRIGEPVKKSGFELCRYEQFAQRMIFPVDSMKYQGVLLKDTMAYSGKAAMITLPFDRTRHFIYGPFISLPKGKYNVVYRIKVNRDMGINNFAVLNISSNYGKSVIKTRTLRLCEFAASNHFEEFDLPLETITDLKGVEFRIMYLGESDLYFDRVVLIRK
jgi:hypothetical protein